jgi:dUTP pyrophosphatase
MLFRLKKLVPEAKIPVVSPGNVGFDITSVEDKIIYAYSTAVIRTGLQLAEAHVNDFAFLKVEGRSGLASRGIFPVGGIIDPSYRGEIKIVLYNGCEDSYQIKKGDRIAQLVCYQVRADDMVIEETTEVTETERGASGFGSSGR